MKRKSFRQKYLYSLCTALFVLLVFGCGEKKASLDALIGTWDGYGANGEIVKVIFEQGHHVVIAIDQAVLEGIYTIDLSIRPFYIINEQEEEQRIDCILDFLSTDTIQIEVLDLGEPRPSSFGDESMVLKRRT